VRPFSEYFCTNCPCTSIEWTMDSRHYCTECNHSASSHVSIFNLELLKPIQDRSSAERQRGLRRLHLITGRIMLRREKKHHVDSMVRDPSVIDSRAHTMLTRRRNCRPKKWSFTTSFSGRSNGTSRRAS